MMSGMFELVFQPVTHESAQPVVRVYRVGQTRAAKRRGDGVGEVTHVIGELARAQAAWRDRP